MPVIVGGTNYYIESLLWRVLVEDSEAESDKLLYDKDLEVYGKRLSDSEFPCESKRKRISNEKISAEVNEEMRKGDEELTESKHDRTEKNNESHLVDDSALRKAVYSDTGLPTEVLYEALARVDPEMASSHHPNDRRKITRSLQVFYQTGRTHTDIIKEQKMEEGGSSLGGPLRYENAVIFWVTCDQATLDKRIEKRTEGMVEQGLLAELTRFHDVNSHSEFDYTKGLMQNIGFKEFHDYLQLSPSQRESEEGRKLIENGKERLKLVTKRYSRKQVKWIRNRFLKIRDRSVPPVFCVDSSDVTQWEEQVYEKAVGILEALAKGESPEASESNPMNSVLRGSDSNVAFEEDDERLDKTRFECNTCSRVIIGKLQWRAHINGAKHKKMLKKVKTISDGYVTVIDV